MLTDLFKSPKVFFMGFLHFLSCRSDVWRWSWHCVVLQATFVVCLSYRRPSPVLTCVLHTVCLMIPCLSGMRRTGNIRFNIFILENHIAYLKPKSQDTPKIRAVFITANYVCITSKCSMSFQLWKRWGNADSKTTKWAVTWEMGITSFATRCDKSHCFQSVISRHFTVNVAGHNLALW